MIVRAVIFDFNGILADDDPIHMKALQKVAEEEGLTLTETDYLEEYLPLNDWDCFRRLWAKNKRPLQEGAVEDLIRRKGAYYFEAIAGQPVLFEGAPEAIRAAAERGPVGIASGARAAEIRSILADAKLLDCFSAIVAAEDVHRGKPDPEPFRLAYERLKGERPELVPGDCLAVEDSLGGIESAHAAEIPCLGVAHSYPRERLAGKARWVIDSISDFGDWLRTI